MFFGLLLLNIPLHLIEAQQTNDTADGAHYRTPWIRYVYSDDTSFNLSCSDYEFYPFNDLDQAAYRIVWQLPDGFGFANLLSGQTLSGWTVSADGKFLMLNSIEVPTGKSIAGIYHCAVLAKMIDNNNSFAWCYLKWGVNLYENEPSMKQGSMSSRYSHNIMLACLTTLVVVISILLLGSVQRFGYEKRMAKATDDTSSKQAEDHSCPYPNNATEIGNSPQSTFHLSAL